MTDKTVARMIIPNASLYNEDYATPETAAAKIFENEFFGLITIRSIEKMNSYQSLVTAVILTD